MLTACVGMVVLLAASIVDYPLRTLLLACVFAVFAAIIASPLPFIRQSTEKRRTQQQ
jgi:hypothetical protein